MWLCVESCGLLNVFCSLSSYFFTPADHSHSQLPSWIDRVWRSRHRHRPVALTYTFFAGIAFFSGSRDSSSCAFKNLAADSSHIVSYLKEMLDTEGRGDHWGIFSVRKLGQWDCGLWAKVSCASLWQLGKMAWTLVKGEEIISSYQPPSNHLLWLWPVRQILTLHGVLSDQLMHSKMLCSKDLFWEVTFTSLIEGKRMNRSLFCISLMNMFAIHMNDTLPFWDFFFLWLIVEKQRLVGSGKKKTSSEQCSILYDFRYVCPLKKALISVLQA